LFNNSGRHFQPTTPEAAHLQDCALAAQEALGTLHRCGFFFIVRQLEEVRASVHKGPPAQLLGAGIETPLIKVVVLQRQL
jgi:hypothetical protein